MNNLKENLAFRQLFREYDIRGRVREGEFDAAALQAITNAFVHFLHNRQITNVVVGYDNRKISPQYAETAADILVNKGFKVYFIGLTITPAAYFAQYHLKAKGLMMITASHNPDGWCGCKLGYDYSTTLGSEDIKELYDLALFNEGLPDKQGSYLHTDIRDAYINDIL
ncbi:MAG: phosphomannomutase/phosphoglucomutase, partial [Clostridia bacterium]|nr:phosphomannomutase/phosphoglucomutase [Clostridia bacterium]